MRHHIHLSAEDDFSGWRAAARRLDQAHVPPETVEWTVGARQYDLFPTSPLSLPMVEEPPRHVPAEFLALAKSVILHSAPTRFALLYRLLWRLREQPRLLAILSDADVARALGYEKDVRRDIHKMKAFVRFRLVSPEGPESYAAWFEPSHNIVRVTAPFFMRRFAGMRWSILTPRGTAYWDGETLSFAPPATRDDAPRDDSEEALWRTYYASIFNPARLMPKAMQAQMPRKYWKNLPEAELIGPLIREAQQRARDMVEAAPTVPLRQKLLAPRVADNAEHAASTLEDLASALVACRRCPLHACATQPVRGEGAFNAGLMIVGEQPGDADDLAGRPFVGPAGRVLDAAFDRIGLERDRAFVTNAVKHFKFIPRGKRRIHQSPDRAEIAACRVWLDQEIKLVRPRAILAMGATAVRSLLGVEDRLADLQGRIVGEIMNVPIFATVHPSFLLCLSDPAEKRTQWRGFLETIRKSGAHAGLTGRA